MLSAVTLRAQKIVFKPHLKVFIGDKANKGFQVKVLETEKDTLMKPEAKVFLADGTFYSYQLTKTLNWKVAKPLDDKLPGLPTLLKKKDVLYADIKPEDGRLMIYFWPYKVDEKSKDKSITEEANKFYKDHSFSIALEDRTVLNFKSTALQAGVLSIPLKMYLGTPDSVSNAQAAISAGAYVGFRFGKTKYVKLPNEKEYTVYQKAWSLNLAGGLNKLDIDDKNTSDKGVKFKGSVPSLSLGIAGGYHFKTFTTFLAVGRDFLLSKRAENWLLKKKLWIGVGIGYDIF